MDNQKQIEQDIQDLQKLGYVQELLREMGGFSNFAVSFSVISILTGGIQLYGYGLGHGGPLQITLGWIIVSFFTMFVALAMAELASAYPTAGALYHWSSFLGGRTLGWFTACFNTVGQFAILAGIDYGMALLLMGLFEIEPSQVKTALIYAVLLLSHATFNHRGVRVVAWLNNFSAWYHIVVVLALVGALFYRGLAQPVEFLAVRTSTDGYGYGYSFLIGLLLAQWTLTGYDASAHVTEETVDPRRNAPWGIFLAVVISVVAGFIMLAAITLSIPNLDEALKMGDNAFQGVLTARLGAVQGRTIVALVMGAMWLCGLAAMTSASRMVYAFARDGGLPFHKFWAAVSPKYRTPANAIWGLSTVAMFLALSVDVYSAVVSIATIALYISYGLPILARVISRLRGRRGEVGPWNLGGWSTVVATIAVAWITFICIVFILPPNERAGYVLAGSVVGLLALWFGYVGKHFKGPRVKFVSDSGSS